MGLYNRFHPAVERGAWPLLKLWKATWTDVVLIISPSSAVVINFFFQDSHTLVNGNFCHATHVHLILDSHAVNTVLLFLASSKFTAPQLKCEPVGGKGSLVISTPDRLGLIIKLLYVLSFI